MNRYIGIGLVVLTACAAHKPRPPAVAHAAVHPVIGKSTRFELEGFGASAEFPTTPEARDSGPKQTDVWTAELSVEGPTRLELSAVTLLGKDRPTDAEWLAKLQTQFAQTKLKDLELDGFRGVEVSSLKDGRKQLQRWWAIGDGLLIATASTAGERVDAALAQRFFDSVHIAPAFRIFAAAETRFSVKVPAHAIVSGKSADSASRETNECFTLGGVADHFYCISGYELEPGVVEAKDPDQALDRAMDFIVKQGHQIIWQGPLQYEGARGREFLSKRKSTVFKGRVLINEHFVYVLMSGATTKEALEDDSTAEFFSSFVMY